MIIDLIENISIYENLSDRISKAINFLNSNELSDLELGRHEIESEAIFAIVQEYNTKSEDESLLEGHIKYIDIQYVMCGSERIGYLPLKGQLPVKEYDENEDYHLFKNKPSFIELNKGMFAIFFPEDLHMPCILNEKSSEVKKIIIKVLI